MYLWSINPEISLYHYNPHVYPIVKQGPFHNTPADPPIPGGLGDVQRAAPAADAKSWAPRPWRQSHRCNRRPGGGFAGPVKQRNDETSYFNIYNG